MHIVYYAAVIYYLKEIQPLAYVHGYRITSGKCPGVGSKSTKTPTPFPSARSGVNPKSGQGVDDYILPCKVYFFAMPSAYFFPNVREAGDRARIPQEERPAHVPTPPITVP